MVEGREQICYMPKQGSQHGGAKQMFTKYAQRKGGYVIALAAKLFHGLF